MEGLVLVGRVSDLRPYIFRSQQVLKTVIHDLGNDLDDCTVLWEVSDSVNIDINTIFLCFFPKVREGVLFFIVRNELRCVLPVFIRIKYREVHLSIGAGTRIRVEVSETDWWLEQRIVECSVVELTIRMEQIVYEVADWSELTST